MADDAANDERGSVRFDAQSDERIARRIAELLISESPTASAWLTDEKMERLESLAREARVTPEEFAQANLDTALLARAAAFEKALEDTLAENIEVYRRLAK